MAPLTTHLLTFQNKGKHPNVNNNAGNHIVKNDFNSIEALYQSKKLNEAFFLARERSIFNQDDPKFLKLAGVISYELKNFDDAESFFRSAKNFDKTDESVTNLAIVLIRNNKQAEALKELRSFSKPLNLSELGKSTLIFLLLNHELYDEAQGYLKKFKDHDPKNPSWDEALARVHEIRGEEDLFAKHMSIAIRNQSDKKIKALYHKKIGIYFTQKDIKEDAVFNYKKALEYNPEDKTLYRLISLVDSEVLEEKDLHLIIDDVNNLSDDKEKSQIYYMLADIADKHKDYPLSGSLYDVASSLQRRDILNNKSYDPNREVGLAKTIIGIFGNYNYNAKRPSETSNKRMIFVVGMPRSGTTLTESILAKHSNVDALGELSYLRNITGRAKFSVTEISNHERIVHFSGSIMEKYISNVSKKSTMSVCVDKMPGNANVIGIALAASSETRVINLVRDPMAVAWSIYSKYFPAHGMGFSFDKNWILNHYRVYLSMMDFWHQIFPGQIFDLNYEKLTEDQRGSTEKLLSYCDLTFEEQCMQFYDNERMVKTASSQQVKKKMYQGSSDKWKRYGEYLESIQEELVNAQNESLEKRKSFHQLLNFDYLTN